MATNRQESRKQIPTRKERLENGKNNYKGRPKVKKQKVKPDDVKEILHAFSVDGVRFEAGDDAGSIPANANLDWLLRRGAISIKEG